MLLTVPTYEESSKLSAALSKGLTQIWEKMGKPKDCSTNSGWIVMDNIVQIWRKYWPYELDDWLMRLDNELGTERDVHSAMKANGGYFPISYPTRLYKMIKACLPEQNLRDKKFIKHMTFRYPFFKTTNYKL